jgi:hypothetical protein
MHLRAFACQTLLLVGCATATGGLANGHVTNAEGGGATGTDTGTGNFARPPRYLPGSVAECEDEDLPDPGPPTPSGPTCRWHGGSRPETLTEIACSSDFEVLAAALPSAVFSGTSAVKFVVDTEDGDALYFINSYLWELHFTFARDRLDGRGRTRVGTHAEFNRREYESATERRFLLGSIVRYRDQNTFTIEMSAGDVATPAQIARAYRRVRAALHWPTDALHYRPVSAEQNDRPAQLPRDIPTLDTNALSAHVTYQPVRPGSAVGRLMRVRAADLDSARLGPRDIVLTDRAPLSIPPVAGVITSELQTPLAHIAILAHSRGIPDMALRGAFDDPTLLRHVGQWVKLRVTRQQWTIEPASPRDVRTNRAPIEVPIDLRPMDLLPLESIDVDDLGAVGAKAAHLGTIASIGQAAPVPRGFVVPVSRYVQFMMDNHFVERAAAILSSRALLDDRPRLEAALADLRRAMEEAPVNRGLVEAIRANIRRVAGNAPVRFRSSTNAEDLAGFSGAGLYTSKTVDLSNPRKTIEEGLREVWASVWNLRAVEERELFGIPHDQVAMAILVHRAFPEERSNGVAITRNLFTRFRPAYTINVQAGEESITNPEGDSTPEQFLYYTFYNEGPRVEVLARSSVTNGAPVLTDAQIEVLGRALAAIHERFLEWYGSHPDYAMDVEFKFDGDGPGGPTLFIKQARPYISGGCSL